MFREYVVKAFNSVVLQLLDQEATEWEDGGTKECKLRAIDSEAATLAILDAPGRPEYQRAVVSGLSGADAMVLVIDASESMSPSFSSSRQLSCSTGNMKLGLKLLLGCLQRF